MRAYRKLHNYHGLTINEQDVGTFSLKGELTFATITQDTLKAIDCSHEGQSIRLDLKEITASDSAGLALMIEWLKISKKNNSTLSFINIPLQLKTLAKMSGFDPNLHLTFQPDEPSTHKTTTNTPWTN
ncbi:MAG: STAS domain-containing protein [Methylococcales bacterium]|nr:STAS domain-containing protein [Methylococcales bacterium]